MSEKKRKRVSQSKSERPHKKIAISSPPSSDTVKVSLLPDVDEWTPLLALTPGLTLPPESSFKPYTKPRPNTIQTSASPKELLLHSSIHPKLDYVAREADTETGQDLLNHYIGVYDPSRETLQLVFTRKLIIRGTLKPSAAPSSPESDDDKTDVPSSQLSARNTLGLTFGTKKYQKAIRALTENAISPSKTKTGSPLDPLASAVVDSMAASTADMPTREVMQAEVTSNKPIPTPNLEAETASEVYTLDSLVGLQKLRNMEVKEWIDKVNNGEEITTRSRFVSARLASLVKCDEIKKLKALKYLLLLLEWHAVLIKDMKGWRVPKKEDSERLSLGWGKDRIAEVKRRFTERGGLELNKWHYNLLLTHILAIVLMIDDCNTDVHDIQNDLHLDNKVIRTLYAELGAPIMPPTEAELAKLKLTKSDAKQSGHNFARLKLPLKFPKMRVVGTRAPRR